MAACSFWLVSVCVGMAACMLTAMFGACLRHEASKIYISDQHERPPKATIFTSKQSPIKGDKKDYRDHKSSQD